MRRRLAAFAVVAQVAVMRPAAADEDRIPGHSADHAVDGAITGLGLAVSAAALLIPIRGHTLWDRQVFEWDEGVKDNFSRRASAISDGLLGVSLVAPAIYLTGSSIDDADGDRLLIYGEAVAINTALVAVTKRLVQRPRPYRYSKDPAVIAYARAHYDDSMQSLYSGHSALTFGAAVTGAYLLGASERSAGARYTAWAAGLGVAAATATLRVRAGKHFYSDVVMGSLVGITVGYAVPALHADGDAYVPSGGEIAAGLGGILGGIALAKVIPLEARAHVQLTPAPVPGGMGLALGGSW
jgi:membrane-associated phospholipid phosphatase